MNPQVQLVTFLDHLEQHQGTTPIYTDGSKDDSGVGYAVVFPTFTRKYSIPDVSSVFTAELRAIRSAVKLALTQTHKQYTVYTDSYSSMQALLCIRSQHPLVLEILEWLFLLEERGKSVDFCWVPSHVGVPGNEEADRLAKSATNTPVVVRSPVPVEDIRSWIRRHSHDVWQARWSEIGPNKLRAIRPSIAQWEYDGKNQQWDTSLSRLRIGHSRITHGYLMEGGPLPYCEDCIVPLTVQHLLAECPNYMELRNQYLGEHRGEHGNYDLSSILGEGAGLMGGGTHRFCEEAGLLGRL